MLDLNYICVCVHAYIHFWKSRHPVWWELGCSGAPLPGASLTTPFAAHFCLILGWCLLKAESFAVYNCLSLSGKSTVNQVISQCWEVISQVCKWQPEWWGRLGDSKCVCSFPGASTNHFHIPCSGEEELPGQWQCPGAPAGLPAYSSKVWAWARYGHGQGTDTEGNGQEWSQHALLCLAGEPRYGLGLALLLLIGNNTRFAMLLLSLQWTFVIISILYWHQRLWMLKSLEVLLPGLNMFLGVAGFGSGRYVCS